MLPETFRTTRLLLRPVAVDDTDAIFDTYVQDEEVARYVIWRPHRNRRETRTYIERCVATPHEVERTYMLVGCEMSSEVPSIRGRGLGLTPAFDFSYWRSVRHPA